jgi:hypothetical protein
MALHVLLLPIDQHQRVPGNGGRHLRMLADIALERGGDCGVLVSWSSAPWWTMRVSVSQTSRSSYVVVRRRYPWESSERIASSARTPVRASATNARARHIRIWAIIGHPPA